jgi:hypothetical protein
VTGEPGQVVIKASIAAKSGTDEEQFIKTVDAAAHIRNLMQWNDLLISDQHSLIEQMTRLLDKHVPDWRERVRFPDTPPPPDL